MGDCLRRERFKDIDIKDPFFDSLKNDYHEFTDWFRRKDDEEAYVFHSDDSIVGFLYLKNEEGEVADVNPPLIPKARLKIGSLKIDAHKTKLGERFLKKAFDHAISANFKELYATVFPHHVPLISLLEEFGFEKAATKTTSNGQELVLVKDLTTAKGDSRKDYPIVSAKHRRKYILSIHPQWHTRLFPDSILENESYDIVQDVSHTNSIRKTYVCSMDLSSLNTGDILIIYRTKDDKGPAWYRSVVTSICTVEEVKTKLDFKSIDDYIDYTERFSVFNAEELKQWWHRSNRLYVIRMLYNAAFSKRIIRKVLVEDHGVDNSGYWGFMEVSNDIFMGLIQAGGISESIVIN